MRFSNAQNLPSLPCERSRRSWKSLRLNATEVPTRFVRCKSSRRGVHSFAAQAELFANMKLVRPRALLRTSSIGSTFAPGANGLRTARPDVRSKGGSRLRGPSHGRPATAWWPNQAVGRHRIFRLGRVAKPFPQSATCHRHAGSPRGVAARTLRRSCRPLACG